MNARHGGRRSAPHGHQARRVGLALGLGLAAACAALSNGRVLSFDPGRNRHAPHARGVSRDGCGRGRAATQAGADPSHVRASSPRRRCRRGSDPTEELRATRLDEEGPARRRAGDEWRLKVGRAVDMLLADTLAGAAGHVELDYSIFSRDVVLEDVRVPEVQLRGIPAYRTARSLLRWTMQAAFERHRVEVLKVTPVTNGAVYVRWRVHLWPRDLLGKTRQFLALVLGQNSPVLHGHGAKQADVVDGYSRYTFDPWTAEVVRHTIEFTSPPTPLADMLSPVTGLVTFQAQGLQLSEPRR